ncbi:uncharacterized protein LOC132547510 [Ylistrum balloti]|uniref:uncharacterized protein LOC132547510 n=1 Tax=Ylistrum balloti TaxID=509963 RepID=UPI002905937D|nr:uncharacterized protein LOC132547510 [Ylistrum balloti]
MGVSRVKNQIDYLLISGQWRSSILDTRVQRGADTNSDHYLVRTNIKLRLQSHRNKKKVKPKIDVDRVKDEETKRKFCKSVRSKLEENRTEIEDIEEIWEQQRSAYTNAAGEVLGSRKGKSKPWITDNTWKLIDERKDIKIRTDSTCSERVKNRMKEDYREKCSEVKRSVREDKRRWMTEKSQLSQQQRTGDRKNSTA